MMRETEGKQGYGHEVFNDDDAAEAGFLSQVGDALHFASHLQQAGGLYALSATANMAFQSKADSRVD